MLFFTVKAKLSDTYELPETFDRRQPNDYAQMIKLKTEIYNAALEKNSPAYNRFTVFTLFDVNNRSREAFICAACKNGILDTYQAGEFLAAIDIMADITEIEECTIEEYCKCLHMANRQYIKSADELLAVIGIDEITDSLSRLRRNRGGFSFSEKVFNHNIVKKDLLSAADRFLCDDNVKAEIERIYKGATISVKQGHPVHYMLCASDKDSEEGMIKLLLDALYQNGRLISRRYARVCYDNDDRSAWEQELTILYESCETVVISYDEDDCEETDFARHGAAVIADVCSVMRKNRNTTLTIFCLSPKSKSVNEWITESIGAVTLVPITQESAFGDRAKNYLKDCAKHMGITGDRKLYKNIAKGKGYTSADLNTIFDEWYDRALRTKVYPYSPYCQEKV